MFILNSKGSRSVCVCGGGIAGRNKGQRGQAQERLQRKNETQRGAVTLREIERLHIGRLNLKLSSNHEK